MDNQKENATDDMIESALKEQLHNAYLKGMAAGGKTFVGVVYDIILKSKEKRSNPMKTLIEVENACKRMLDVTSTYDQKETRAAIKRVLDNLDSENSIGIANKQR